MPKRTKPEAKPLPHADSPVVIADSGETMEASVGSVEHVGSKPGRCGVCGTAGKRGSRCAVDGWVIP